MSTRSSGAVKNVKSCAVTTSVPKLEDREHEVTQDIRPLDVLEPKEASLPVPHRASLDGNTGRHPALHGEVTSKQNLDCGLSSILFPSHTKKKTKLEKENRQK